ncbi:MAG: hypothetical protein GC190_10640 [Alphaproteobacteria bacterium]|nr:hypothetical protein [Alphaproteobacteria bacterium]
MTANKAYFRIRQSAIDESYLTRLAKAGVGGGLKNVEKKSAASAVPAPLRRLGPYWESPVVEWHAIFDEAPLRAIAQNLADVTRRIGRPDDLHVALHIEVHVDWDLPHTGVPMSASTMRLLADLDASVDIDIVPNLSPP